MNTGELLALLYQQLTDGIFTDGVAERESIPAPLEPDHLLIYLVRTTPYVDLQKHSNELTSLIQLSVTGRAKDLSSTSAELGIEKGDCIRFNSARLLFMQDMLETVARARVRSRRRRSRVSWHFYEIIELARVQLLIARYLAAYFDKLRFQMITAKNCSAPFLKTLLKSNFYSEPIATFAADLPRLSTELYSQFRGTHKLFAERIGLPQQMESLQQSQDNFLVEASNWKPGIMSVIDLVKIGT
jgi:hypothetical protein